LYQRSDDQPDVIKRRIQVYQEQTSPILQHYKEKNTPFIISSITALDTPPETIVEEMIEELKKLNLA
jgi:adenylate kinase